MYYELYVDVLFLVNFFMDYILLLFAWRILHCDSNYKRIAMGAMLGAILTCILIILPIPNAFLELILFHTVVNTCMINVGLKIKNISVYLKALILLYVGAFFMGGIVESLSQYIKVGSMILLFAIVGYYMSLGMWNFLEKVKRWNTYIVKVDLVDSGKNVKVKGLIDTGNSLYDAVTGEPVSIVTKEIARKFIGSGEKNIRLIPYQSIGKASGMMSIFRIEKMCVTGENSFIFHNVLLGVSEENISINKQYEMILNPNLF